MKAHGVHDGQQVTRVEGADEPLARLLGVISDGFADLIQDGVHLAVGDLEADCKYKYLDTLCAPLVLVPAHVQPRQGFTIMH